MPFEPQLPVAIEGDIQALVVLDPAFTPSTIVRRDTNCHIQTKWHIKGLLALGLGGAWTVRAFLESMGPGAEMVAGTQAVLMSAGTIVLPDKKEFTSTIQVNAGSVPAGVYKLVVAITYTEPGGTPGPLAAYQEGPIVQFFDA